MTSSLTSRHQDILKSKKWQHLVYFFDKIKQESTLGAYTPFTSNLHIKNINKK